MDSSIFKALHLVVAKQSYSEEFLEMVDEHVGNWGDEVIKSELVDYLKSSKLQVPKAEDHKKLFRVVFFNESEFNQFMSKGQLPWKTHEAESWSYSETAIKRFISTYLDSLDQYWDLQFCAVFGKDVSIEERILDVSALSKYLSKNGSLAKSECEVLVSGQKVKKTDVVKLFIANSKNNKVAQVEDLSSKTDIEKAKAKVS